MFKSLGMNLRVGSPVDLSKRKSHIVWLGVRLKPSPSKKSLRLRVTTASIWDLNDSLFDALQKTNPPNLFRAIIRGWLEQVAHIQPQVAKSIDVDALLRKHGVSKSGIINMCGQLIDLFKAK